MVHCTLAASRAEIQDSGGSYYRMVSFSKISPSRTRLAGMCASQAYARRSCGWRCVKYREPSDVDIWRARLMKEVEAHSDSHDAKLTRGLRQPRFLLLAARLDVGYHTSFMLIFGWQIQSIGGHFKLRSSAQSSGTNGLHAAASSLLTASSKAGG